MERGNTRTREDKEDDRDSSSRVEGGQREGERV